MSELAPQVWPTLQARDARTLIDFLVETFGFVVNVCYEDEGTIAHVELLWPEGGGIMLGSYKIGGQWSREPGTFGGYVVSERVEELYEHVVASGAIITQKLADTDYGSREFGAADPEGNLWRFGTYRGHPRAD